MPSPTRRSTNAASDCNQSACYCDRACVSGQVYGTTSLQNSADNMQSLRGRGDTDAKEVLRVVIKQVRVILRDKAARSRE